MAEQTDFAAFLRSRRERTSPQDVGLPAAGRRRTPGLRREELATLAGISVDYVVRLEQGRERNPSVAVIHALARTLRLSADESRHLIYLAKQMSCDPLCPSLTTEPDVDEATRTLLAQLDGTPAFVLSPLTDVLAWSRAYESLMAATGLLELEPPNLLRYTFLVPGSRDLYRNWEGIAREQVGNLRAVSALGRDDGALRALVGDLSVASSDFARLWAEHDVSEKRRGRTELKHPVVGDLDIDFTTFGLPDESGQLVVYAPADAATGAALQRLATTSVAEDSDGPNPRVGVLKVVS
ncbi:MAG: helix-turn-helix domain-containing protein [Acidimicrobiales bacterium]